MTRRSKREIERSLEDLNPDTDRESIDVVWRDPVSGEYVTQDGEPTEPDPDADTVIVFRESIVMGRERAEEKGREILGPAEDVPDGRDVVEVAPEGRGDD